MCSFVDDQILLALVQTLKFFCKTYILLFFYKPMKLPYVDGAKPLVCL